MRDIRALSIDLDDTLWDIAPVIEAAETAVQALLNQNFPEVAARFGTAELRALRTATAERHPDIAHDFTEVRRRTYAAALTECGRDPAQADSVLACFLAARNRVTLYPDVVPALSWLRSRLPLVALTNGNTDVRRLDISVHFAHVLRAREVGVLKPHRRMFQCACDALGLEPGEVLHVGDHPVEDIAGARATGMRAVWINRRGLDWPGADPQPEAVVKDMGEVVDLIRHSSGMP